MFTSAHIDIFGYILNNVYHLHLVVELQSLLREIAKTHGIANIKLSAIRRYLSQKHFYECRLTRAVVSNDTHFLKAREIVIEVLKNNLIIECF